MAKVSDLKCRNCGKCAHEIGGYLERLNRGELPSIWECRPSCDSKLNDTDAFIMAMKVTPKEGE